MFNNSDHHLATVRGAAGISTRQVRSSFTTTRPWLWEESKSGLPASCPKRDQKRQKRVTIYALTPNTVVQSQPKIRKEKPSTFPKHRVPRSLKRSRQPESRKKRPGYSKHPGNSTVLNRKSQPKQSKLLKFRSQKLLTKRNRSNSGSRRSCLKTSYGSCTIAKRTQK